MSYIQFESSREKEKIRQDLREAREQLLEKAKKGAEQRAQREVRKELTGETNWMLPAVAEKIDKQSNKSEPSKKTKRRKDKKSKEKKSKKSSKKRKHCSSNEDSSDSENDLCDRKSRKKSKKKKKTRSREYSDSSSDEDTDSTDGNSAKPETKRKEKKINSNSRSTSDNESNEWIEQPNAQKSSLQRDSWMTDTIMLKTFSRDRPEKKPINEKQQIDTYDPAKSTRELNPYWKSTGTGLPGFQKPTDEDGAKPTNNASISINSRAINVNTSRNWQKKTSENDKSTKQAKSSLKQTYVDRTSSSSPSSNEGVDEVQPRNQRKATETADKFLTDQQMNELGAKILKAEIMGNTELAEELKKKLESERNNRSAFKDRKETVNNKIEMEEKTKRQKMKGDEHILLTHTDERGNCRPLTQARTAAAVDPRELYGGRSGRKKQNKRIDTHVDGERVRYFPDDDKYDIKQMFEREKYSNAADSNLQFANIASQHKNPNDDLDDIFADKIRKTISKEDTDKKEFHRAVHEHQKLAAQLDKCTRCFDSEKMDKKLLVSMGQKVYLALPWHIGLQTGHCVIVPTQHISCSTQLDEDTWDEITNFRKALTRMFAAQRKDVVFFEIANKLNAQPHLSIHCVPIPDAQAEMTPFYFKKAIEESEREWSVNKQLVSLRNKGLRSCIPKGLPYFWVNFGMDSGFAHVIEDQDRFPPNFAQEIIGGMLHLDVNKWRKPQREQNAIAKVKIFADWWKKYDCTN